MVCDNAASMMEGGVLAKARQSLELAGPFDGAIMFWRGTSGHMYPHTAYSLRGCPPTPPALVLFIRRTGRGVRRVRDALVVDDPSATLNLATIRQHGAKIEADEVHLHYGPSGSKSARQTACIDLKTRLAERDATGQA